MKTDAAIRPINVLVGSETQFCVKKPPAPPIKVIDAAGTTLRFCFIVL